MLNVSGVLFSLKLFSRYLRISVVRVVSVNRVGSSLQIGVCVVFSWKDSVIEIEW